jgi:hypothetical protein
MEAKQIIITIIALAILGMVLTKLPQLDVIINSISRFSIRELALLQMRPDYNSIAN